MQNLMNIGEWQKTDAANHSGRTNCIVTHCSGCEGLIKCRASYKSCSIIQTLYLKKYLAGTGLRSHWNNLLALSLLLLTLVSSVSTASKDSAVTLSFWCCFNKHKGPIWFAHTLNNTGLLSNTEQMLTVLSGPVFLLSSLFAAFTSLLRIFLLLARVFLTIATAGPFTFFFFFFTST